MYISALFNGMKIIAGLRPDEQKQTKKLVISVTKGTNPHKFFTIHSVVFAVVYEIISLGR